MNQDGSLVAIGISIDGDASLDGNVVILNGSGDATVQLNIGTSKKATFVRAELAP